MFAADLFGNTSAVASVDVHQFQWFDDLKIKEIILGTLFSI